jgi:hypothetical protein
MRSIVRSTFPTFSKTFEGRLPHPYLDVKCLVTVGVGDLIDPVSLALPLPWQIGGRPATQAEIIAGWQRVKAATDWALRGGGAFATLTELRLTDAAIDDLMLGRLAQMESIFSSRLNVAAGDDGAWLAACADAQLGCLSMCWAMGPSFHYPKFMADLAAENFATYSLDADGVEQLVGGCALECYIPDATNRGLKPRNAANRALFEAAQRVKDQQLDPDVLHYQDAA